MIYYDYCENCAQDLDDYFITYDANTDTMLTLTEFKCWWCEIVNGNMNGACPDCNPHSNELEPSTVFNEFAGNDGKLDQSEFAIVYYLHCQHCTESMSEIFSQYDKDDDDLLALDPEFNCLWCETV